LNAGANASENGAARATGRLKVLGLSDALTSPTGFGRVARELWTRLPQDELDLAYMSYGWPGSSRFPGIQTYGETGGANVSMCQAIFPKVAIDFAGLKEHFVLWTLLDPWQTSWLSYPETSPLAHEAATRYLRDHRDQFTWIGHFPIDGRGPRNGPPRWVELMLDGTDIPVLYCQWAVDLCQPWCKKELRWIDHAVNDSFFAMDKAKAKEIIQGQYYRFLARMLKDKGPHEPQAFMQMLERKAIRLQDQFVVICVMANRARKYWPEVLRAFAMLVEKQPNVRLIGLCGDRIGRADDSWALETICQEQGLRLDHASEDPNVWLLEYVGGSQLDEDATMNLLYNAADCAVLLSGGEGRGLPQLEAHACGIPCIVGDYSASTGLAVHSMELLSPRGFMGMSQNEVQRPIYSARDLADRLLYAARNPRWRQEVGAKGLEQAAQHRWSKILPQWVDLFREAGMKTVKETVDEAVLTPAPVAP